MPSLPSCCTLDQALTHSLLTSVSKYSLPGPELLIFHALLHLISTILVIWVFLVPSFLLTGTVGLREAGKTEFGWNPRCLAPGPTLCWWDPRFARERNAWIQTLSPQGCLLSPPWLGVPWRGAEEGRESQVPHDLGTWPRVCGVSGGGEGAWP